MEPDRSHLELVRQAVAGDSESAAALASAVETRVRAYLNRIVLDEDKSQELTQDTLGVVMGSLGSLRDVERFWPWVFRIATNKSRQHFRYQGRHRTISMSALGEESYSELTRTYEDGYLQVARQEMGELTRSALSALSERYRMALTLRFYEDLPHAEIATVLGCSEITARATFFRAKHALVRELKRRGIREASLFAALIAFGQLTAPSSSSAAVVVSAAAATESAITGLLTAKVKIGFAAVFILAAVTFWNLSKSDAGGNSASSSPSASRLKTDMVATSTVGEDQNSPDSPLYVHVVSKGYSLGAIRSNEAFYDYWVYFPKGARGPHLLRLEPVNAEDRSRYDGFIRTEDMIYHIIARKKGTRIVNGLQLCNALHTEVLPTDSAALCASIHSVEGDMSHALVNKKGFTFERDALTGFVIGGMDVRQKEPYRITVEYGPPVQGDPFSYLSPADWKLVDSRDVMHKRGWTFFRVSGQLAGQPIAGTGRVPFTYRASELHNGWLKLNVGGKLRLVDDGRTAYLFNERNEIVSSHPGGSGFAGLSRPWMGFHTLDSIRRDAAEDQIWYSMEESDKDQKIITLVSKDRETSAMARFTVDMGKDLLDRIQLYTGPDGVFEEQRGMLTFDYVDDVETVTDEFVEPSATGDLSAVAAGATKLGPLWLLKLFPADINHLHVAHAQESANSVARSGR